MKTTLGNRIYQLRREKNITQEAMAEHLGITAQAVSKWENDLSCPDIALLVQLAGMLDVTVDQLLSGEEKAVTQYVPAENRKKMEDMMLRVVVNTTKGDKVRVNLPMPLIKVAIDTGLSMGQMAGNEALKSIDFEQIFQMVQSGMIGRLVEVETAEGDFVEVVVE